ncbi:dihydrodipicolinate synthase [Yamadazyma tenuis]|uniref:Aldolase n=1 Tax=Candida tenuis (strain ATCC 10573 / BCRC 21748 / CBS 615 / JCM 9827 / NBRC 10315 / NRRL Y-1498 / VKM Y-70) TaxID=590646 RepID=G3B407_CANTC|nr:aldolase [Yamadazyma tenuis ATCC 10573]EGV63906.1 aldolase [Yamadazyma tenuis ATCC 10573]WEJ96473.1 dihydrodipicolinate synthase [Yamadazyma tenuis]
MTASTFETPIGKGIYTPVPTFFTGENYELDLESQIAHAKFLYSSGINGVVTGGSMGESIHLTRQERLEIVKAIRSAVPSDEFKIISGMPYTNIPDTIAEIKALKDAGANYTILLTPGYYGNSLTTQQGIIDYFTLVGDKSALPIVIYHYPGVSNGTEINPETFEVLSKHPSIVGVKLTHFNMDKYVLLTGRVEENKANNFRPFTGLGQILVPSLAIGAFGAIDGLSGVFPKSMLKLFELFNNKQYEEAQKLQFLVTRANQMVFSLNLIGVKHALNVIHGFGDSNVSGRPPLNHQVDLKVWNKYEDDIKKLGEFEKSLS